MVKNGEETTLKTPNTAAKLAENLKNGKKNTTKKKISKITTVKFKCTREHVLGHDWLLKIT